MKTKSDEITEKIILGQREVPFIRKLSKGRSLRVSIDLLGNLKVHHPSFVNINKIRDFLIQKSEWIISKLNYVSLLDTRLVNSRKKRRASFGRDKSLALELFIAKVNTWNRYYGFEYKEVRVRAQKSRWGSCSKQGVLSFNYNLIFLDTELLDYVVIHEICHLKEFNHKKEFWNLVSRACPNYIELRTRLKKVAL